MSPVARFLWGEGYRLIVIGYRLIVIGYRLIVIGYRLIAIVNRAPGTNRENGRRRYRHGEGFDYDYDNDNDLKQTNQNTGVPVLRSTGGIGCVIIIF
jgi:hypothetical protein